MIVAKERARGVSIHLYFDAGWERIHPEKCPREFAVVFVDRVNTRIVSTLELVKAGSESFQIALDRHRLDLGWRSANAHSGLLHIAGTRPWLTAPELTLLHLGRF